jgi:hypothetical protein
MTALFFLSYGLLFTGLAVIIAKEFKEYRREWK